MREQAAQESFVFIRGVRIGPGDGTLSQSFLFGGSIGATAFITIIANALVIIARDRWDLQIPDQPNDFVRVGAITDQVTQAVLFWMNNQLSL